MFDAHPPFQIDGNFGGTSGIAEMLLQSQNGEIELLPALPSAWTAGEIRGLKARGGFEVDIAWQNYRPSQVVIRNLSGNPTSVRFKDKQIALKAKRGGITRLEAQYFVSNTASSK